MNKKIFFLFLAAAFVTNPSFAQSPPALVAECEVFDITVANKNLLIAKRKFPMNREEREMQGVDSDHYEEIQINKRLSLGLRLTLVSKKNKTVRQEINLRLGSLNPDDSGRGSSRVSLLSGYGYDGFNFKSGVPLPLSRRIDFQYPLSTEEEDDADENGQRYPEIFHVSCKHVRK